MNDLEKFEKEVKKEKNRLTKLFKGNVPNNQMKLIEGLIIQAKMADTNIFRNLKRLNLMNASDRLLSSSLLTISPIRRLLNSWLVTYHQKLKIN